MRILVLISQVSESIDKNQHYFLNVGPYDFRNHGIADGIVELADKTESIVKRAILRD